VSLTLIAALTWPGRVIGKDNAIPWKLSEDLRRFKAATLGHPVIMGRQTWDSLPFKLPGRSNGVLSRQAKPLVNARGETPDFLADSLQGALDLARLQTGGQDVFVIGGAQLYAAALPLADRLLLTQIHHAFEGNVLFPEFEFSAWYLSLCEPHRHEGDPSFEYTFLEFRRIQFREPAQNMNQ